VAAHVLDDRRGVEATAQKRADRHVAHHLQANRFLETPAELLEKLRIGPRVTRTQRLGREVEIPPQRGVAGFPGQDGSGAQAAHTTQDGLLPDRIAESQIVG
jgi:hypothetical protein